MKAGDRYSSDTGFGVGIETAANVEGCLKQVIDLKRTGKEVVQGDELECLVHYSTIESKRREGPFRLALRWLDAAGNELVSTEKDFINNPDIYFGRMKAYGDLKFRTVCPNWCSEVRVCSFGSSRKSGTHGRLQCVTFIRQG